MSKFAQVQKQQKQLPYTVSPIGDEVALKYWKEYRAQVDATYKAEADIRFQTRRDNAVGYVTNQDINPFTYTQAEREELEVRKARLTAAKERLASAKADLEATGMSVDEPAPEAPTFLQRIKQFFNV